MRRRDVLALGAASMLPGVAGAQASRVVVYTAARQDIVDALTTQFSKETGIRADVVTAGSSDVIRRARAEASAPRADVIWSIGAEVLEANKDLFTPYSPAEASALVPAYAVSKEWVPFSGILVSFVVNTKLLKPEEYPHSWRDLTDPKWKGQIASARADSSGSAFQQYATVLTIYGEQGWDTYKRILANMQLADSSGLVSRLVNDGEAKVGIVLEDDALQYLKGGGPVALVYPEDGTSTIADGMALVKGGPNPQTGRKFIDWLVTRPVQQMVASKIDRRSVRTDVPPSAAARPLNQIKVIDYNIPAIAAKRGEWIARWREAAAGR